ncbi:MAG: adenylate kinase family protein [Parcubacteria group bacterium Gr01-1014_70]|nr:MAG: adenylate kinase family protein [Parcubacteria group bacterium Gr01-1014_70]
MEKPLNIIFLGLSGSGKGTQAQLLRDFFQRRGIIMNWVSTGDLCRGLAKEDTDLGHHMRETLDEGKFAPSAVLVGLWIAYLRSNVQEYEGIISDGSPRKLPEAKLMDELFTYMSRTETLRVISIRITPTEIRKRLIEGRKRFDDTPERVESRIQEYEKFVVPVIDYYRDQDRLIEINGDQSVEKVHEDIIKALNLEARLPSGSRASKF